MHTHHPHAAIVYIIYGLILLAGGIYGFAKTNSRPSLIAGIASAVVSIIAAIVFRHHPRVGLAIGALLGLILCAFFAGRFKSTGKAMPAIPISVLSALIFLYSIISYLRIHHLAIHGS